MKKRKMVENWDCAWRWASIRCMTVAAAIQGAWTFIPDDMRSSIPHGVVEVITISLLVVGVAGRVTVPCEEKHDDPKS